MLENGLKECTCRKKRCERHGKCAECIEFHKTSKYVPYCKRKKAAFGCLMKTVIKPLTKENLDDFLNFFDNIAFTDNQSWSGCYCFYHHFDGSNEEWEQRTAESNREAAARLIREGKMKGYLAFYNGMPVGWCNANDKANFSGLVSNKEIWDNSNKKVCSIVCFIIAPEYRRKGLASQILNVICNDFSKNGYDYIEAYPRKGVLTSAEQYHGPSAMYKKAGFMLYKEFKGYDIVRKKL